MEDTKITQEVENKIPKAYNPNPALIEWFQKRIILEQERREFSEEKRNEDVGQKLPNRFFKDIKESAARKAELIDKIIFPAMTDLIYFLEAIEICPPLKKLFEKDLIKLFDPRSVKEDARMRDMGTRTSSYAFRWNNLTRLVSKAVSLNYTTKPDSKIVDDFRVALLYQLQSIIKDEVSYIMHKEFGYAGQVSQSAMKDFDNTLGWLALVAKHIADNAEKEPDKIIGFSPITFSNRAGLSNFTL